MNNTPAKKSSGFADTVPSIKSKEAAAMIDTWEQAAAGYARQYMTVPALRLLCDVLLDLADVQRRCAERQPLECSERLCRLAAQLAGLAGITMLDLGDHRLARSFFRTARTAADETGDRRLRAWVAVREALVPLYYGDLRVVVFADCFNFANLLDHSMGIVDNFNNAVWKLNLSTSAITQIATATLLPDTVAVDSSGALYVTDSGTSPPTVYVVLNP